MNRFSQRLLDLVSRPLDADEREAVLGDLMESHSSGGQTISDVIGLIVGRPATLWLDWRPWLALLGVAAPLGMLLSLLARWWSEGSAISAFVYLHNGEWTYLSYPGWRSDVIHIAASTGLSYLALACWAWTTGFA